MSAPAHNDRAAQNERLRRAVDDILRCTSMHSRQSMLRALTHALDDPRDRLGYGRNVRALRLAARTTQEQLAARIGHGCSYVSDLEAGKVTPTDVLTQRLAVALRVEPTWITGPSPDPDAMLRTADEAQAYLMRRARAG